MKTNRKVNFKSYRVFLSSSMIMLASAIVLILGIVTYFFINRIEYSNYQSIHDFSTNMAIEKISNYLDASLKINEQNAEFYQNSNYSVDLDTFTRMFYSQLQSNPDIVAVGFADSQKDYRLPNRMYDNSGKQVYALNISDATTGYLPFTYQLDPSGNIDRGTVFYQGREPYDPAQRPWYLAAVQAGKVAFTPIYVWLDGRIGFESVLPCYDASRVLKGVFTTSYILTDFGSFLDGLKPTLNSSIYIVDSSDQLIACTGRAQPILKTDGGYKLMSARNCSIQTVSASAVAISGIGGLGAVGGSRNFAFDINGQKQYGMIIPYQNNGLNWYIVCVSPQSDIAAAANNYGVGILLFFAVAFVAVMIVSIALSNRLIRPVKMLSQSLTTFSSGNFRERIYSSRSDEIGQLIETYNLMADKLESAYSSLKESEEKFRIIAENCNDIITLRGSDMEYLFISPSLLDHLGYTPEEFSRIEIGSYVVEGDRDAYLQTLREMTKSPMHRKIAFRTYAKDHRVQYMEGIYTSIFDEEGKFSWLAGVLRDITESVKAQEDLRLEKEHLQITLGSIGDGMIATDREGIVTMINGAAETLTGYYDHSAVGRRFDEIFDIYSEYSSTKQESPVNKVLRSGKIVEMENHTVIHSADGNTYAIADSAAPILGSDGAIEGVVLVFRDVTEKTRREKEIEFLSFHDVLTGLYNRAYFDHCLKEINSSGGRPISLIMGDLNGLKLINDVFGHTSGDLLLITIANVLKKCCPGNSTIARWGGDEFCVILPECDSSSANEIVRSVYAACEETPVSSGENTFKLSISLGFSTWITPDGSIYSVLHEAEDNMYKRKLLESKSLHSAVLNSICATLYEKSRETEDHARRITELSFMVGKKLGLDEDQLDGLRLLAMLHDIGKIAIDNNILSKPGSLNEREWEEIKRHPEIGYRITQSSPEIMHIANYILCHHERWDGNGYPQRLKGDEIPLASRILAIVDSFDAMTQDRVYRKAMTIDSALLELHVNAGSQFDPKLTALFIQILSEQWGGQSAGIPVL